MIIKLPNHWAFNQSIESALSTTASTLIISQHQLSSSSQACQLSDSISLLSHAQFLLTQIFLSFSFFWFKFSHSFFCYFFVQLISFSHLRFWSDLLLQMTILSCAVLLLRNFLFALFLIMFCLLVWDFSQVYFYKLLFNLVQHFQKRSLFALSNFRNANFSSICIQCVRVNLVNLIDKNLISSVNQIQSEVSNQL